MDDGCQAAVSKHFVELYNKGLIYQGEYIVNWCPKNKTALSDIEVEYKETNGHLWHMKYPLTSDPSTAIIVATAVLKPCLVTRVLPFIQMMSAINT